MMVMTWQNKNVNLNGLQPRRLRFGQLRKESKVRLIEITRFSEDEYASARKKLESST